MIEFSPTTNINLGNIKHFLTNMKASGSLKDSFIILLELELYDTEKNPL